MSLDAVVRFRIPKPDLDRLTDVSKRSGLSVSDIIRQATLDYVRRAEAAGKFEIPIEATARGILLAAEPQTPFAQIRYAEPQSPPVTEKIVVMGDGRSGKSALVAERSIRYPKTRIPK